MRLLIYILGMFGGGCIAESWSPVEDYGAGPLVSGENPAFLNGPFISGIESTTAIARLVATATDDSGSLVVSPAALSSLFVGNTLNYEVMVPIRNQGPTPKCLSGYEGMAAVNANGDILDFAEPVWTVGDIGVYKNVVTNACIAPSSEALVIRTFMGNADDVAGVVLVGEFDSSKIDGSGGIDVAGDQWRAPTSNVVALSYSGTRDENFGPNYLEIEVENFGDEPAFVDPFNSTYVVFDDNSIPRFWGNFDTFSLSAEALAPGEKATLSESAKILFYRGNIQAIWVQVMSVEYSAFSQQSVNQ